jgi:parvulin-like peptidyl-prolyl isomerase
MSIPRLALALAIALVAGCRSTPSAPPATAASPDTWAIVNGREIKRDEVEKAYRRQADPAQTLSNEETLAAKLGLLNDLIVEEILLAKARELKIELTDTEIDNAYAEARKNVSEADFQKELSRRNLSAGDMREGLRREMLTQKVIEREVTSKVAVSDQEVTDFFNANKAQFNLPEEAYHLAQIVITPVREQQVTNRTGDDATTPQAANAKLTMIMERLKSGASFRDLAVDYSEDPDTGARGGDLGFVPVSRLKQAPQAMRDAVIGHKPGTANVVSQGGAHTVVLIVGHELAGQRDLTMQPVKDRITETLRGRKVQLLRVAYLTALRNDARVEHLLARRVVESQGKMP